MPARQTGFLLLPVLVMVLLAMLLIGFFTRDLGQSYLSHKLALYQNCRQHLEQIKSTNTNRCPPCPLPKACADD